MRTVLFAAASSLCLAFAAHGAEAPAPDAAQAAVTQALPAGAPPANNCIDTGASMSKAAYSTDEDAECCSAAQYCSQYLSTQMLVQAPATGHT